ncbi:phosphorylase [Arachnia propionica]|uniref:Uridine phosphorylase n=1 Tax=Arachnia propionica TaxID=1750 RepID=A0A3P1T6K2_9ACTN|nr:nucleoside phosphorylase [Arachnia propionica]MDO5082662.1 nucleoside phosphorylase [Arachnia propionica]RRD05147.1 phosphorylase [Arachnia propionica]
MLQRGDFPVLDFDDDPDDLVLGNPPRDPVPGLFPERAVIAFLGETVDEFASRRGAPVIHTEVTINGTHPYWRIDTGSGPVVLVRAHLGAPMAVLLADPLFRCGVKEAVAVGSCGALHHFEEGEWLVPARALRDEGTSHRYLPPSRWVELDPELTARCVAVIRERDLAVATVDVWTTDAILRETRAMVQARRAEGCSVVDMECAALAASARMHKVRFGQILFSADSLAGDEHDPRGWGRSSHELALELALEAVAR